MPDPDRERQKELTGTAQKYLTRADSSFAMMGFRVDTGAAEVKSRPFVAFRALQQPGIAEAQGGERSAG